SSVSSADTREFFSFGRSKRAHHALIARAHSLIVSMPIAQLDIVEFGRDDKIRLLTVRRGVDPDGRRTYEQAHNRRWLSEAVLQDPLREIRRIDEIPGVDRTALGDIDADGDAVMHCLHHIGG